MGLYRVVYCFKWKYFLDYEWNQLLLYFLLRMHGWHAVKASCPARCNFRGGRRDDSSKARYPNEADTFLPGQPPV